MHYMYLLSSLVPLVLALLAPSSQAACPPTLAKLFTANIKLGTVLKPIPIPGGVRIVEPLVGGNITGPAVNATVTGGIAYPPVYNNGTLEVPQILVWGTTTDGYPFFVQEMGIGSITQQVTRLQIDIGGRYANLANIFIVGDINASADKLNIIVVGYQVTAG